MLKTARRIVGFTSVLVLLVVLSPGLGGNMGQEVRANHVPCTLELLRGSYGLQFEFLNTSPDAVPATIGDFTHIPGGGIGVVTYDGRGNWTARTTVSFGGQIFESNPSGTYAVNPDCTGTRAGTFPGGPTFELGMVIMDQAREIRELSVQQGDLALGVQRKQ